MARFYGNKILANVMKLEDVPILFRERTEKWLSQNGTNSGTI